MTDTAISKQLSMPRSTVPNIIRRCYNEEHNLHEQRGRNFVIKAKCNRRLLRMVQENRFKPLYFINALFRTVEGKNQCAYCPTLRKAC